jgi:SAM-dependent methyltransferase
VLVEWLDAGPPPDGSPPALVVGCGLGDDATELARRGYDVTAFDRSPTAIDWCRRRFPDSGVDFQIGDVFALQAAWRRYFRLVVEINTIQSLPVPRRAEVIAAIAATVARGGLLFVRCVLRNDGDPVESRPWPVSPAQLRLFAGEGLRELSYEITDVSPDGTEHARAVWTRD